MEISRNIFKANNRPYVGIFEVKVENKLDSKEMIVETIMKNAGSVPASDVELKAKIFVNKNLTESKGLPDKRFVILPLETKRVIAYFKIDNSPTKGKAPLEIKMEYDINYRGISPDQFCTHDISEYDPSINAFVVVSGEFQCAILANKP